MGAETTRLDDLVSRNYPPGPATGLSHDIVRRGLDESVIRRISAGQSEPEFMLDWRLKAYRHWLGMSEPGWSTVHHPPIDYQAINYCPPPTTRRDGPPLAGVDPKLLALYAKLGVPLDERGLLAGVAVDAGRNSSPAAGEDQLAHLGILFCSFAEAVRQHPELVRKYLGSVVPHTDNYFACLNSAVFADGTFCYIPPGVRCPQELITCSTLNVTNGGQFRRTLIVADRDSAVSYREGGAAPAGGNGLQAAVVELIALEGAEIRYATVHNGYSGDQNGKGGVYNFVTQRGECRGDRSRIAWTQVETGSAITWKYPSVILRGDHSRGEFRSVAMTGRWQQADTGSKMIHIGRHTRSSIVAKGIAAGHGRNAYRGLVRVAGSAVGARNRTQCDSLLLGDRCAAHTFPYIEVKHHSARVDHQATTSRIGEDQLFYSRSRGLSAGEALAVIVDGFCKEVFRELPMDFAAEARQLLTASLEGSLG